MKAWMSPRLKVSSITACTASGVGAEGTEMGIARYSFRTTLSSTMLLTGGIFDPRFLGFAG